MVCGNGWVRATLGYHAASAKTRRGGYELTMLATVTRASWTPRADELIGERDRLIHVPGGFVFT